jgi:hypothetical protein
MHAPEQAHPLASTGLYHCASAVELGRPANKSELLQIIQDYDLVKGVGVGHR